MIFFLILIVVVAFLLVVVIMVQNPKGGGLSSSFGGGGTQQLGGVKQTSDFLDRATWVLAGTLIVLILLSNINFDSRVNRLDDATNTEQNQEIPANTQGSPSGDSQTPDNTQGN